MSVSPFQQAPIASLPVTVVAAPLDSFTVDAELFRPPDTRQADERQAGNGGRYNDASTELLQRLLKQGVLPLVSPSGLLEGVLLDYALLANHVLDSSDQVLLLPEGDCLTSGNSPVPFLNCPVRLNLPMLLQESRRAMVSLRTRQTVLDAQALLYATQYPLIPIVDEQGRYTGTAVSRARLFALITGQSQPAGQGSGKGVLEIEKRRPFWFTLLNAFSNITVAPCLLPYLLCGASLMLLLFFLIAGLNRIAFHVPD